MGDAKRRLPNWMSRTTTPIPVPENHTVDNGAEEKGTRRSIKKSQLVGGEENHKFDIGTDKKETGKSIRKPQLVGGEEIHMVDNGTEKRRARKLIKKHQVVNDEDDSCFPDKTKKRKTKKQVEARKKLKIHPSKKENAEEEDDYDNEEELTVDDLINIAKEYVDADARKEHELGSTIEPETGKLITTNFKMSNKDSEVLPAYTSLDLLPNSYESKSKGQAEEETMYSSIGTGDPAQDMLNLFLGPLLKKSNVEVTNREIYKEDIVLDHNLQKQSQKEESEKQLPTLMKKKSSLRDKVAMLLD